MGKYSEAEKTAMGQNVALGSKAHHAYGASGDAANCPLSRKRVFCGCSHK